MRDPLDRADDLYEKRRDDLLDKQNPIAKAEARAKRESLERTFALQCRMANLAPEPQFKIPGLNYRWDFAFRPWMLLCEIQGQIWQKGAHNTGTGLTRDYKKNNAAVQAGWHTLYFTAADIKDGSALKFVQNYLDTHCPF